MKGCSTCKYYNNTCGRYLMNPELLKDPKECGKLETDYPHWDLYMTDEIKERVFAQYPFQRWKFKNEAKGFEKAIKHRLHLSEINDILYNPEYKECGGIILILKPLSEITDEDAIQVDELISPQYSSIKYFHTSTRGKVWIRDILAGNQVSNVIQVYQFLQSKGYDLPYYILGNKTLQESGLAIYENN